MSKVVEFLGNVARYAYILFCLMMALPGFTKGVLYGSLFLLTAYLATNHFKKTFLKGKNQIAGKPVIALSIIAFVISFFVLILSPNPEKEPLQAEPQPLSTQPVAQAPTEPTEPAPKPSEPTPEPPKQQAESSDVESKTSSMDFATCQNFVLSSEAEMLSIGLATKTIVQSDVLIIKRFCTADGSVLMTCSKPDNKLVVTKSPHTENCN